MILRATVIIVALAVKVEFLAFSSAVAASFFVGTQ